MVPEPPQHGPRIDEVLQDLARDKDVEFPAEGKLDVFYVANDNVIQDCCGIASRRRYQLYADVTAAPAISLGIGAGGAISAADFEN